MRTDDGTSLVGEIADVGDQDTSVAPGPAVRVLGLRVRLRAPHYNRAKLSH